MTTVETSRGTGDPGDNRAGDVSLSHDADRGVESPYNLVTVTWEETSLDMLHPAAESGAKDSRASWSKNIEGSVAREIGDTGKSFILATSSASGGGWRSRTSSPLTGVGDQGFVEQGGTRLGQLALFRKGRGSLVSLLKIVFVVVCVSDGESSGSRWRLGRVRGFCQRQPLVTLSPHVVGGAFAGLFAPRSRRRTNFGRPKRSVQARAGGPAGPVALAFSVGTIFTVSYLYCQREFSKPLSVLK